MLKEIYKGIYDTIDRPDIPLMASDLTEPKDRPGFKIFLKPTVQRINKDTRITEIAVLILYYASDRYSYYSEHCEVAEAIEDAVMGGIETENGLILDTDEVEFGNDADILTAEFEISVDTFVDSEEDNELMEELYALVNMTEVDVVNE